MEASHTWRKVNTVGVVVEYFGDWEGSNVLWEEFVPEFGQLFGRNVDFVTNIELDVDVVARVLCNAFSREVILDGTCVFSEVTEVLKHVLGFLAAEVQVLSGGGEDVGGSIT